MRRQARRTPLRRTPWALSGLSAVFVASCSGNPTGPADAASFCADWARALADRASRCAALSEATARLDVGFFDPCRDVAASISAGRLRFDASHAGACLTELQTLPCWQTAAAAASCAKTYVGQVPANGSCFRTLLNPSECAIGSACDTSTQCPGACVPLAQLGEPCAGGGMASSCDPSLWCDPVSQTCVVTPDGGAPGGVNEACGVGRSCQYGLICEGPNGPRRYDPSGATPLTGSCQPPPGSGPCFYDSECSNHCNGASPPRYSGMCAPWKVLGERCVPGNKECAPETYCGSASVCVDLPRVGEACSNNTTEGAGCLDGFCDGTTNVCKKFLSAGDRCATASGFGSPYACGFRLQCDASNICLPSCLPGEPCGSEGGVCCYSGLCAAGTQCVAGTCVRCGDPGQPCCMSDGGAGSCSASAACMCSSPEGGPSACSCQ
jgi:hypothetical protein